MEGGKTARHTVIYSPWNMSNTSLRVATIAPIRSISVIIAVAHIFTVVERPELDEEHDGLYKSQ